MTQAIDAKKLVKSVDVVAGKRRIVDVALADQEWAANSTRAPRLVKPAASQAPAQAVPAASPAPAPPIVHSTPAPAADGAAHAPSAQSEAAGLPEQGELVLGSTLNDAQMAFTNERTRKTWLENRQKEGRLVDRTLVVKEAFEANRIIREGLFNIAARISGKLAAETDPTKVSLILDAAVRECLTGIADELVASHG